MVFQGPTNATTRSMQCHGQLRRPLWIIVKSLGESHRHDSIRQGTSRFSLPIQPCLQHQRTAASFAEALQAGGSDGYQEALAPSQRVAPGRHRQLQRRSSHEGEQPGSVHRQDGLRHHTSDSSELSNGRRRVDHEIEGKTVAKDGVAPTLNGRFRFVKTDVAQENTSSNSAFEDAVASSEGRQRDGTPEALSKPRLKRGSELSFRYFKLHEENRRHLSNRQAKRMEIQEQRHPEALDQWHSILTLLDDATPQGTQHHTKRMETVAVPEGVRVAFTRNEMSSVVEIMRRTGSHVQTIPLREERDLGSLAAGFEALTLWGLPDENERAIKLLSSLVTPVTADTQERSDSPERLQEDEPRAEVTDRQVTESFLNRDDPMAESYWHDEGDINEEVADVVQDTPHISPAPGSPVRATWVRRQAHSQLSAKELIEARPSTWTVLSFADYVEDLTAPTPRLARMHSERRPKADPTTHRVATVSQMLQELFTDEDLNQYVSSESVDQALGFLVHHRAMPVIKRILGRLEESSNRSNGYKLTVSNCDILLASATIAGDVYNFGYIVRLMLQRDIRPSWRTWARFHELACRRTALGVDVRGQVFEKMRTKGILANPNALTETVSGFIDSDLRTYMHNPESTIDGFFKFYDAKFANLAVSPDSEGRANHPRSWLSTSNGNRMTKCLLSLGRVEDALTVVTRLIEAGERLHVSSVNTFLAAAYRQRDAEHAISVLQFFHPYLAWHTLDSRSRKVRLNGMSYGILFQLAWRKRFYNVLKAVWRYACMCGHVTWPMQWKVRQSLVSYVPTRGPLGGRNDHGLGNSDLWFGWAGKFVLGVDERLHGSSVGWSEGEKHAGTRLTPVAKPEDNALSPSTATPAIGGAAEITPPLSSYQNTMLSLSVQPRTAKSTQATSDSTAPSPSQLHVHRKEKLYQLLNADLDCVSGLQPMEPFTKVLESAWRKDVTWRSRGLGRVSDEGAALATAAKDGDMQPFERVFGRMLSESVHVPVGRVNQAPTWSSSSQNGSA